MAKRLVKTFWIKSIIGGAAAVLGLMTLVWPTWIETLFGVDPDHGNGILEWFIVGTLLVLALVLGFLAHADRRQIVRTRDPRGLTSEG